MAKKQPKEGIFLRKSSKGFNALLKENKFKLAFIGGYNSKPSVQKGLRAIYHLLNRTYDPVTGKFALTDLTLKAPKKKA